MSPRPNDTENRELREQIAADLRALIMSGDIAEGEKIPSTKQLMDQYGTQNGTIQEAVDILKAEGLVAGRKGAGVFVIAAPKIIQPSHYPSPPTDGQPFPWISDMADRGHRPSVELIEVKRVPAPAQIAAAFGLPRSSSVMLRYQRLLLDADANVRIPLELVSSYYPLDIAEGTPLAEHHKIKGGTPRLLADLGHPLGRGIDQVSSRMATTEEFARLGLHKYAPVLRQFRVVYDQAGRAVEAQVIVKTGRHYELLYDLPNAD